MGGENWETRRGRSRAGLLRSPRDLHLDLATFGALQSLRSFAALLSLLGTAFATLGRKLAFQGSFGGICPSVASAVPRSAKSAAKERRDCRAPKVARSKCKSRGDRSKPSRLLPNRVSQFSPPTPSSRERSIYGLFFPERISFYRTLFPGKPFTTVYGPPP